MNVKLFQWVSITCALCAVFLLVKAYAPTIKVMYPNQCSFLIDDQLASDVQLSLQEYILDHYKRDKDPDFIIQNVSKEFPEVQNADAFMCNSGALCFSCDAFKPLFKVNNECLIGDKQQVVKVERYQQELVDGLYNVEVQGNQYSSGLVHFFKALPEEILRNFSIKWIADYEIELQSKKGSDVLLFSADSNLVDQDVELFNYVKSNVLHKSKYKKRVYDFRFKKQVIVR